MAAPKSAANEDEISRDRLAELLNEDLSRSAALRFIPRDEMEAQGYGQYLDQVEDTQ